MLPEDSDDENFPIGVSDDDSEEKDESGSSSENGSPSETDKLGENESGTDSIETYSESNEGNSIKSREFASGEN